MVDDPSPSAPSSSTEQHAPKAFAMPGDIIMRVPDGGALRLGSGLRQFGDVIKATKAGHLQQHTTPDRRWLECRHQRYVPSARDLVVGTVMEARSDAYVVDVGAPAFALLPPLEFTGATRRNRPLLRRGDAVYARVAVARPDADLATLSCVDKSGRKARGLGPLKGGYVFGASASLARHLLAQPPAPILAAVGAQAAFEIAVGVNARVWVTSPSRRRTFAIAQAIQGIDGAAYLAPQAPHAPACLVDAQEAAHAVAQAEEDDDEG